MGSPDGVWSDSDAEEWFDKNVGKRVLIQYRYMLGSGMESMEALDTREGVIHSVNKEKKVLVLDPHECARQVLDVHEREGRSVVGLKVTPEAELRSFGTATGTWLEGEEGSVLHITEFAEKPEPDYAREHLHVDGMADGDYLTVFGLYVLAPEIFEYLDENISNNVRERGEFQLTSCLDRLRREQGFLGYVVEGRRFDIGLPDAYRKTLIEFREA